MRGIGLAQHIHGREGFIAGAAQRSVHSLRVERLESAFDGRRLREHFELADVGQRDCRRRAAQRQRQIRAHGHGAKGRSVRLGYFDQRAIQPSVIGGAHARRAGFHVILRVEMRAAGIG